MMSGIIYVGCTSTTRAIIEAHIKYHPDIQIAGIVGLANGENKINYDDLLDFLTLKNINVIHCMKINSPSMRAWIKDLNPTLIIQSGWSGKFGKKLLSIPKYGCIGQHPSPLPRGRGAAALNWAIINGETNWGNTFFRMTDEYDKGEIISQTYFEITENDTYKTLLEVVDEQSHNAIFRNLQYWYGGARALGHSQNEKEATSYGKRTPEMGEMELDWPHKKMKRHVRALTKPCNGAYFKTFEGKIYIWNHNQIVEDE